MGSRGVFGAGEGCGAGGRGSGVRVGMGQAVPGSCARLGCGKEREGC